MRSCRNIYCHLLLIRRLLRNSQLNRGYRGFSGENFFHLFYNLRLLNWSWGLSLGDLSWNCDFLFFYRCRLNFFFLNRRYRDFILSYWRLNRSFFLFNEWSHDFILDDLRWLNLFLFYWCRRWFLCSYRSSSALIWCFCCASITFFLM